MNATVTHLPTAVKSYLRIRKAGSTWLLEIVTPLANGKKLANAVAKSSEFDMLKMHGLETAARMQRPLKLPRGR